VLYWTCKDFNGLPEPGAILDQDAGLLSRMRVLGNVYDGLRRIRNLTGEQIHNMSDSDARLWAWLEQQGVM
jgi:hypothetical protein